MRRWTAVCLSLCLLFWLPGCRRAPTRFSYTYLDVFDTVTTFSLYASSQQQADEFAGQLHEKLTELHRLYTIYDRQDGEANLWTVNHSEGQPVTVDARVFSLLRLGKEAYALSAGKVNIAMGSVLSLWHDARENGLAHPEKAALPGKTALQSAAAHCRIDDLILDIDTLTVRLNDPAMSLDVGAVAKGYAAQQAAKLAREIGVTAGLISIGGNVVAIGGKPDGAPFTIGIEDPLGGSDYALTVQVRDGAVVTSGNYQRYYTVNGVRYHHLIDPDTLYPADYTASVSVIGPDSGMADILSTALFLLPIDKGKALIEQTDGYEAVWILPDGSQIYSKGFSPAT